MNKVFLSIVSLSLIFSLGCSCFPMVEREELVDLCEREDYVKKHPECRFGENILSGEIVRGMEGNEVMASWGLPNVYLLSKNGPNEYWVYYVHNEDSRSILIYTLTFNDKNNLADWDIDIKRFNGGSYVYSPGNQEIPVSDSKASDRR